MGNTIESLRAAVEAARIEAERAEAHRVETAKLPLTVENRGPRLRAASASDFARMKLGDARSRLAVALDPFCRVSPRKVG